MKKITHQSDTADREIVITRVFDAPRDLVFKTWTDPNHLINWWGPSGFTNTFHEINIKPGGKWRFTMHGPDGINYANLITFSEVVIPERLAYEHGSGETNDPNKFNLW
ncbi:MAG: SRPBCC domain-containing protein [Mucilaginibacter sp.]